MRIKESKNLKYDKKIRPSDSFYDYNVFEPKFCILENFERVGDRLELNFKNRCRAVILAKNLEGSKEIELIADKLDGFIDHSYEEILIADF